MAASSGRAGSGSDARSAQEIRDERMRLEEFQFELRIEVLVFPVQPEDQAHRHLVLAHAIEESAAEDVVPAGIT